MSKRHHSLQEDRSVSSSDTEPSPSIQQEKEQSSPSASQDNKMQSVMNSMSTGIIRGRPKLNRSMSQSEPTDRPSTRIRISPAAVSAFEYVYAVEKKPNDALIKVLGQAFGESYARVKVWFQNRRGRDRGSGVDETSGNPRRPSNFPPTVLQTLLSQNPSMNSEFSQELADATRSSDIADTTAQALNAMLTVNSISKYWGNYNHLLSNEIVTAGGDRKTLANLATDPSVTSSPMAKALLERLVELRQGVIDQFVMSDGLLRGALPLRIEQPPDSLDSLRSTFGTPLDTVSASFGPDQVAFGPLVPSIPDVGMSMVNWEIAGYHPYEGPLHHQEPGMDPYLQAQFPYGDVDHPTEDGQYQWEFVNEDYQLRPPSPGSSSPRQVPDESTCPINSMSSTMGMLDVDLSTIPIVTWMLESLLKSIQKAELDPDADMDEIYEAISTIHFPPSDFAQLSYFLGYYDATNLDAEQSNGKRISVRIAPTLEGHAGWYMSGQDFATVLVAPLNEMFLDIIHDSGAHINLVQVYLVYDLGDHVLNLKCIFQAE